MALKKILLGTTALLTAAGLAGAASAAEIKPLGALDINLGGFARQYLFLGDLKDKTGRNTGSYDLRTDTEVYVYVRGKDEATGLEYGANIELEADTNSTSDADEAFTFIRGQFGEFRFGDDDGAVTTARLAPIRSPRSPAASTPSVPSICRPSWMAPTRATTPRSPTTARTSPASRRA